MFDQGKTRASYDRVARHYAEEIAGELANKPYDRSFLDRFVELVGEGRIVELGCGPGHVSAYLHGRGANVSGLDLSSEMVDQAKELFPEVEFRVGDMLALPLKDGSVEAVISFYSIVHFDSEQTERAFAEMARVLAPGGQAGIAFHIGNDVIHRKEWFSERVDIDFRLHEPATVRRQLELAGLTIESIDERDPYPPPIEFQTRRCYVVALKP